MKIFITQSVDYLSKHFSVEKYVLNKFCDGDFYLRVNTDVENEDVFIITNTISPSQNILELTFLLDALSRLNVKINIFFTYFAYARQDRVMRQGEALSAEVVSRFIRLFNINKIYILHPHSDRLFQFLDFKPIIPFDFFNQVAEKYDVIASPDVGGVPVVQRVAKSNNCKFVYFQKKRFGPDRVGINVLKNNENVDIEGKKILIIDDMVTTGSTAIKAAQVLVDHGASSVSVAATHPVFCDNAKLDLQNSLIQKIYITDSIKKEELTSKFEVYSIIPIIQSLINLS
jgi:ribose-phosphate pyrophosphokinase